MNPEKDDTILSDFSLLVDSERRLMSRNSILMMISVIVIISIANVLIVTLSIPSSPECHRSPVCRPETGDSCRIRSDPGGDSLCQFCSFPVGEYDSL